MAASDDDQKVLLRIFFEVCYSHDDLGPSDDTPMLARMLRPDVKEFLDLYELSRTCTPF